MAAWASVVRSWLRGKGVAVRPNAYPHHATTEMTLTCYRAEKIKEDYTYVCQDIVKEFKKYDGDPYRYFARFDGEDSVTGKVCLHP
jgi:hypothetical protein